MSRIIIKQEIDAINDVNNTHRDEFIKVLSQEENLSTDLREKLQLKTVCLKISINKTTALVRRDLVNYSRHVVAKNNKCALHK